MSGRRRRAGAVSKPASIAALAAAALFFALPASAQSLDIEGVYGNETGCRVEADGPYGGDDKFILRPSELEAHESLCEIVGVMPARTGASVVTTLCQAEGMYEIRMYTISQPDPENDSLLVFFSTGELWHEVRPCR